MKSKRRVSEDADSGVGIKKFLYSNEDESQPDDGNISESPSSSEAGLPGGLVIKSFYGSNSYLNPLERKINRENKNQVSIPATSQLQDAPKCPKEEPVICKSTKLSGQTKLEVKGAKKGSVRKLETSKNSRQKSTKPLTNTKSLNTSKTDSDSHNSFSDNSVNSTPNKFFRSRSPRKNALLSKRGPAMLINRGFSIKFQLTPGPKLQKQQQKMLPKVSTITHTNCSNEPSIDNNQNQTCKVRIVAEDDCVTNDDEMDSPLDIASSAIQEINNVEVDTAAGIASPTIQEISDIEVDTAADIASSDIQDAGTRENKEKGRSDDEDEMLCKADPSNMLNASVSDLFALSETSEMYSSQSQVNEDKKKKSPQSKLFPIFGADSPDVRLPRQRILTTSNRDSPQPKSSSRPKKSDKEQMILDFGQKLIGSVPCSGCGMTYLRGDSTDETMHNKFHQFLLNALKFTGWQKERVVQDFLDGSRVIMIVPDDKFALKKLEAIKKIVDDDLGFVVDESLSCLWKAFLFVKEKKVVGFCLAQNINQGYRMLADSQSQESVSDHRQPFCCGDKAETVRCGISRIWVLASQRRKHIATKLLDVVRSHFLMGYPLSKEEIAFSDPTPDGIKFASKYTKTQSFLVFRK